MRYIPWSIWGPAAGDGFDVTDDFGRGVGDLYPHAGVWRFSHEAECYDPIEITADDLRAIASKLDELNGVSNHG